MAVDPVIFPINIKQDATGGPTFHTTVVTAGSGYETRNADQVAARIHWDVGQYITNQSDLDTLTAFFRARQGQARGFLFLDYSDFYTGMVWSGDTLVAGTPMEFATGDGTTRVFQLSKTYPDTYNPVTRKITRPMNGTVTIYLGPSYTPQTTGFSIDYNTGLVTFTSPVTSGVQISWSGQFYVPVRFSSDSMKITLHHIQLGEWQSVGLIEILE